MKYDTAMICRKCGSVQYVEFDRDASYRCPDCLSPDVEEVRFDPDKDLGKAGAKNDSPVAYMHRIRCFRVPLFGRNGDSR